MSTIHQSILFDQPGPRALRRIRIATVASLLVLGALVAFALNRFAQVGQLNADRWAPFTDWVTIEFLWSGIVGTVRATAIATALAFPLGAIVALLRLSTSAVMAFAAGVYVTIFRSIPLLLVLYAFLLVLPGYGLNLSIFWKLVVPIVLVNTAIVAEVFRAGVQSLPIGQTEAGKAIGLRHWQTMRLIVLPQAIRIVLPALITALISILKDTTLGYVVSYPELMQRATTLTGYTHLLVQTFLVVTAIYICVNLILSRIASMLDTALRRSPRVSADPTRAEAAETGFH